MGTGTTGWGDIPVDFYEPVKEVVNVVPVYFIDSKTSKLSQINADGDYPPNDCINSVKEMLQVENTSPAGAVLVLLQGGKK